MRGPGGIQVLAVFPVGLFFRDVRGSEAAAAVVFKDRSGQIGGNVFSGAPRASFSSSPFLVPSV